MISSQAIAPELLFDNDSEMNSYKTCLILFDGRCTPDRDLRSRPWHENLCKEGLRMDGRLLKEFLSIPMDPDEVWRSAAVRLAKSRGVQRDVGSLLPG